MLSSFPVWLHQPELPGLLWMSDPRQRNEWDFGREFLRFHGTKSLYYLLIGRLASLPWSLLGMWVAARWSRELWGARASLLTIVLWTFSPSLLAHGHLMTGDMAAAASGLALVYWFRHWLKGPCVASSMLFGLILGGTILIKTSWLLMAFLLPGLWLGGQVLSVLRREVTWKTWASLLIAQSFQWLIVAFFATLLINIAYEFSGSGTRLSEYRFFSKELSGEHDLKTLDDSSWQGDNRFLGRWLAAIPVPFPKDFVVGLDLQKWDFQRVRMSYLRGEWRDRGWWYYYLYVSAIKEPLPFLALLGLATLLSFRDWRGFEELVLFAPAVAIYFLVSRETGLTKHIRYVLPALPFAVVFVSRIAAVKLSWVGARGIALLFAWYVSSSLWIYPHSLSYFNELIGGPMNAAEHVIGSNIDWGQDLTYLRRWQEAHPEATPMSVASYVHTVPLEAIGVQSVGEPFNYNPGRFNARNGPRAGWFAVDVGHLRPEDGLYRIYDQLNPVAMAGYSFRIYHLTENEAAVLSQEKAERN
jgi:hypothetical protein